MHSRLGSRLMNLSATRTIMSHPAAWKSVRQSSCGGVQRNEASVTPPCSPMVTPGPSTTCQACECMETWSCNNVSKRLGTAQVGSIREEGWRHARRAGLRETERKCAQAELKRVLFKVLILFPMSPNHKIAQKCKVSKIRHYMLSTSSEVIIHISKPNVNAPAVTRPRACVLRQGK